MIDDSYTGRIEGLVGVVRRVRARLRSRTERAGRTDGTGGTDRSRTADAVRAYEATDTDGGAPAAEYFCRTCGAGFRGRHGTCPQCGGGMIERGIETR